MRIFLLGLCALALSCSTEAHHATPSDQSGTTVDPHRYLREDGVLKLAMVKQPYHGGRNVAELSQSPTYLEEGGIREILTETGLALKPVQTATLSREEAEEYGEWHRLGLANGHLADLVAENERQGYLTVGLLANCNALIGMLGGFQSSGETDAPRAVGLVWIDAHGDFNTPETTLSGMLGGMPVAVSAGLALDRLRRESHLDFPISTENIVMLGVRDTDPEEQELMEAHDLTVIPSQHIRDGSEALHDRMARLSEAVDLIYIHIDMDVLDPREVQGHGLTVPDGPTSQQLAAALREMFAYPKVAGLGIASTPAYEADPGELSRQAAYRLILGALEGARSR